MPSSVFMGDHPCSPAYGVVCAVLPGRGRPCSASPLIGPDLVDSLAAVGCIRDEPGVAPPVINPDLGDRSTAAASDASLCPARDHRR